ncbi:neural cell adhesion molecule 1-like [Ptychodera flava]|uniref:neural cell adhesion molecule 1-like n=1 Tax=Ptychodera flava TaxID=63121 RepID=UPI00396A8BFF
MIETISPKHFGIYNISAENHVGVVYIEIILEPTGPPESPTLKLLEQYYENLTIAIIPGFNGGDADGVRYTLEYREFGTKIFTPWLSKSEVQVTSVGNLQPGSIYEFRAFAENRFGVGDISNGYQFKTYAHPNITFDQKTGVLRWTPHENENYYCVKIEMKNGGTDASWL